MEQVLSHWLNRGKKCAVTLHHQHVVYHAQDVLPHECTFGANVPCFRPCVPKGTALHLGKGHEVAAWLPPAAQRLCKGKAGHPTAAGAH